MKLGKWIDSEFNNSTMRRSELQIATVNAFYILALFFPGIKAWEHFTALSSAGLMAWRTEKKKNAKWAHCEKYVSADCKSKWKSWYSQQKREHFKLQTQRDKVAPFKASRFFCCLRKCPHCTAGLLLSKHIPSKSQLPIQFCDTHQAILQSILNTLVKTFESNIWRQPEPQEK